MSDEAEMTREELLKQFAHDGEEPPKEWKALYEWVRKESKYKDVIDLTEPLRRKRAMRAARSVRKPWVRFVRWFRSLWPATAFHEVSIYGDLKEVRLFLPKDRK
jgi:hypothetical protein